MADELGEECGGAAMGSWSKGSEATGAMVVEAAGDWVWLRLPDPQVPGRAFHGVLLAQDEAHEGPLLGEANLKRWLDLAKAGSAKASLASFSSSGSESSLGWRSSAAGIPGCSRCRQLPQPTAPPRKRAAGQRLDPCRPNKALARDLLKPAPKDSAKDSVTVDRRVGAQRRKPAVVVRHVEPPPLRPTDDPPSSVEQEQSSDEAPLAVAKEAARIPRIRIVGSGETGSPKVVAPSKASSSSQRASVQTPPSKASSNKILRFSDNSSRRSASAFLANLMSSPVKAKSASSDIASTSAESEKVPDEAPATNGGRPRDEEEAVLPVGEVVERWGLRVGDVVWAKMPREPWWPSQIFSFNATEETCVTWLGTTQHGFVGRASLEGWVEAFAKRYNVKRRSNKYQAAVADGIRRHAVRQPRLHDYYQGLAPPAVRALASPSPAKAPAPKPTAAKTTSPSEAADAKEAPEEGPTARTEASVSESVSESAAEKDSDKARPEPCTADSRAHSPQSTT